MANKLYSLPATYVKKPMPESAIELQPENTDKLLAMCGTAIKYHPWTGVVLETPNGDVCVNRGDFVTKGGPGEFFHWPRKLFEATYEMD